MPIYQDVTINRTTRAGINLADFFVNPKAEGALPSSSHVVLPDDTVPVYVVLGDSTTLGNTASGVWNAKGVTEYVEKQGDDWPASLLDGSAYGYFWNKFMDFGDATSGTLTRGVGALVDINTSGDGWIPMNPRIGGIQFNGNFTYTLQDGGPTTVEQRVNDVISNAIGTGAPVTDPIANHPSGPPTATYNGYVGSICPLWDFARTTKDLFRKADGTPIPPYFIFLAVASTRFGTPGTFPYFDIPLDFHNRNGLSSVNFSTETINDGASQFENNYMEMFSAGGVSGYQWEHYVTVENPSAASALFAYDYEVGDKLIFSGSFDNSADATLSSTSNPIEFAFEMTIDASTQVDAQESAWYYQNSYQEIIGYNKGNPIYGPTEYTEPRWIKGPPELTDIPAGSRDQNLYLEIYADPDGGPVYDGLSIKLEKASAGDIPNQELGYAYRQFRQTYLRPAVNHIMTVLSKNPVHVGNLFMLGGIDAAAQYPDSYQLSAADTQNNVIESLRYDLSASVAAPTMQYLPWTTKNGGKILYPPSKTRTIARKIFNNQERGVRRAVSLEDLPLLSVGNAGQVGIYMNPIEYAYYGERFARHYMSLLSTPITKKEIIAPTMANIRLG